MSWLSDLIIRIKGDSTHLDNTLSKSQTTVGAWAGKLAGFIKGAFAIGAIVQFGKMVIGASEDLNDKFTAAVAGARGALREFFSILATGDFSHFFANLREGYEKAHKLAEELDLFQDKKAYTEYVLSGKKAEAAGYEGIVKDASGKYSLDTRKEYAIKLKAIEQEILTMTLDMAKETAGLEAQAWENRNKMTVAQAKKLYEDVAKISKEKQDEANAAYDKYIKKYGVSSFLKSSGVLPWIFKYETDVLKQYKDLMIKGETELIPKLFKTYQTEAEARDAAQTRFNGVLRITNALLSQQEDIIKGHGREGLIPVSGGPAMPGSLSTINPFKLAEKGTSVTELTDLQKQWLSGWEQVAGEATAFMEDAFVNLFERIGSGNFEGFGKDLLDGFGRLLVNLGKMLISFGTTMLLALTLAKTPSIPTAVAAIAVGASALAIGGLMIGAASNWSSSPTSGGSAGSYSGGSNGTSGGQLRVIVEGRIEGRDIYISNRRYSDEIKRNT
jgi:hypothetical protein